MTIPQKPSKALHISLWIAQILLAAMFLFAGFLKSTQPIEQLRLTIPWVPMVPKSLVRFIGISELFGALGLILPSLLRIRPSLTVLAATGLAIIQVLAIIFHSMRGEFNALGLNVVIGLIAAFIAWGRSKKAPIQPKA